MLMVEATHRRPDRRLVCRHWGARYGLGVGGGGAPSAASEPGNAPTPRPPGCGVTGTDYGRSEEFSDGKRSLVTG